MKLHQEKYAFYLLNSTVSLYLLHSDRFAYSVAAITPLRARGYTPLAYSLAQIRGDFPQSAGRRVVVLLSDGADSCDGDSVAEIAKLKAEGIDVQVQAIGIQPDAETKAELQSLAAITGGRATSIDSLSGLSAALESAVAAAFAPPSATARSSKLPIQPISFGSHEITLSEPFQRYQFPCAVGEKFSIRFLIIGSMPSDPFIMKLRASNGSVLFSLTGRTGESEVVESAQNGQCSLDVLGSTGIKLSLDIRQLVRFSP